jgi:predicted RNA-binding Zn-ribbon protein involved in translation (DUF1610 family)
MKVEAYRCDRCGFIKQDDAIQGIIPSEDIFEKLESFPICPNPAKTSVHVCTECYDKEVVQKARVINKKTNAKEHELKLKELAYNLKHTCVMNVYNKKKFAVSY